MTQQLTVKLGQTQKGTPCQRVPDALVSRGIPNMSHIHQKTIFWNKGNETSILPILG